MPREIKEIKDFLQKEVLDLLDFPRHPSTREKDAEGNQGDQGLPSEGQEEGCQERQDQEECREHQVQGPVLKIPLHPEDHRQGEGREAEAVSAPRPPGQGAEVNSCIYFSSTHNFSWQFIVTYSPKTHGYCYDWKIRGNCEIVM